MNEKDNNIQEKKEEVVRKTRTRTRSERAPREKRTVDRTRRPRKEYVK